MRKIFEKDKQAVTGSIKISDVDPHKASVEESFLSTPQLILCWSEPLNFLNLAQVRLPLHVFFFYYKHTI